MIELGTENFIFRRVPLEYKAKAIFGIPQKSLRYIKIDGVPFFEVPVAQVEGKSYNLNTFERTFVFDGYPVPAAGAKPAPRPRGFDPRAHFALVCGAIGCPPLQPRAFLPESLDVQLDARADRGHGQDAGRRQQEARCSPGTRTTSAARRARSSS